MRRGRIIIALAATFAAALVALPAAAFADGGTPMDICQDLQDGKLDGTYTVAQLQAFFSDPTVQGYCSPVVTIAPPTTPPPAKPSSPSPAPTPAPAPAPVAAGVAATTHTTKPAPVVKTAAVKGAQHTTRPPKQAGVAPLSTARKSGTLPFTGLQLALFLFVGLALVATGSVLRATGRRRRTGS